MSSHQNAVALWWSPSFSSWQCGAWKTSRTTALRVASNIDGIKSNWCGHQRNNYKQKLCNQLQSTKSRGLMHHTGRVAEECFANQFVAEDSTIIPRPAIQRLTNTTRSSSISKGNRNCFTQLRLGQNMFSKILPWECVWNLLGIRWKCIQLWSHIAMVRIGNVLDSKPFQSFHLPS